MAEVTGGGVTAAGEPHPNRHTARQPTRRRRLLTRGGPVLLVAIVSFAAGAVWAIGPGRAERQMVTEYVRAWTRGDVAHMYSLLDRSSRATTSKVQFAADLLGTAETATLESLKLIRVGSRQGDEIPVVMRVRTRIWGTLKETLEVPLSGDGGGARVHFSNLLLFPGLRPGEQLKRTIKLPARATILAADGEVLAQGRGRTSPIPDVAGQVVGTVGPIPGALAGEYAMQGYPAGAHVGVNGLELALQSRLVGTIGGRLRAGGRILATAAPVQAQPVMSTISPALERAALAAIGSSYAGMVVMDPRTGGIEALAGIAYSDLQPPGSTMKIITATAALQAGIVHLGTTFPIQTSTSIEGVTLQNANGEACGGTFLNAFAVSCNSVFAPLGAQLGGTRLVAMAERFGFNQQPSIPGAVESMIPPADQIGDALAVGSSAIGQGLVQTTPLEMADVAATIAMGGRRPIPTVLARQRPRFVRVTSPRIAREVQQMMVAVVQFGTGTAAQIPGVEVAGKTGTAELKNTVVPTTNPNNPNNPTNPNSPDNPKNTDAWFVGYAPVGHPRVVAGALFPNNGAGGATAAPPVHDVLVAALGR